MKHGIGTMESVGEVGQRVAGYLLGEDESFVASRPTRYGGRTMRSRLEAAFARHLDKMGEEWAYEPAIYGPVGEGYKPDFQILSASRPTFIEVKATRGEVTVAQKRMAVIWDAHPNALLIVACAEESRFFGAVAEGDWTTWQEVWKHA
jgi:hypothetical protein